jgi:hypothetical protein
LVFVDASEDSVLVDNVITLLNPSVTPIEKKKFEETTLDVNVSDAPLSSLLDPLEGLSVLSCGKLELEGRS